MKLKQSERSIDGKELISLCFAVAMQGGSIKDVSKKTGIYPAKILSRLKTLKELYPQYAGFRFVVKQKLDYVPRKSARLDASTIDRLTMLVKEQMKQ